MFGYVIREQPCGALRDDDHHEKCPRAVRPQEKPERSMPTSLELGVPLARER